MHGDTCYSSNSASRFRIRTGQRKHLEQHRITLPGSLTPAAVVLPTVYAMRTRVLMGSAIFFPTREAVLRRNMLRLRTEPDIRVYLCRQSMCLCCEAEIESAVSIRIGSKEG